MKRALADVLWTAANECLSEWNWHGASCCAAYEAEFGHVWDCDHIRWDRAAKASKSVQFLRSLGCPVGSSTAFDKFKTPDRQGARYIWLVLAMHVAEDEGIEIEVAE